MVHMLERAREVHKLNNGLTGRDSKYRCPFCIADEDEQWFKFKYEYRNHPETSSLPRPNRMPAPHCVNCPLQSLFNVDVQKLMDDCVKMGTFALKIVEGRLDG
jgi:ribosome modulation factor